MRPEQIRGVADREKDLWTDCPYCVPVRPLWDAFREAVRVAGRDVYVAPDGPTPLMAERLLLDNMALRCNHCNDTGRVLTQLGEALAAVLAKRLPAKADKGEEEIPF